VVKEGWVEKRAQAAKPSGNVAKVSTKAG
jgi:hypothetical protein